MNLSINALMMVMFSVQRDIKHHEQLNNDQLLEQEEREDHGQYALDLTQVLGELGMAYKAAQQAHPEFPSLEELLEKMDAQGVLAPKG